MSEPDDRHEASVLRMRRDALRGMLASPLWEAERRTGELDAEGRRVLDALTAELAEVERRLAEAPAA
jgi:hypothetical protein